MTILAAENVLKAGDNIALGTAVAVLAGWVPTLVGLFTMAWIGMQLVINWPKFKAEVKSWFNRGDDH